MMKTLSRLLRSAVLAVLLASALLLFHWSRIGDPRFYRFLETRAGSWMAGFFHWYGNAPPDLPEDRGEAAMTPEEQETKRRLEQEVLADLPTHELVFLDGATAEGRVVEERSNGVVLVRTYGDSAEITAVIPRQRLREVRRLEQGDPGITYREVRFQMDFPGLRFYRRPPFSILTDESYFRVEQTVEVLRALHEQFLDTWQDLIADERRGRQIQLLFFSKLEDFRDYQGRHAPHMAGTAGFYNPRQDRLVLYNQRASERVAELRAQLDAEVSRHGAESASPAWQGHLREWRTRMNQDIDQFAEIQTRVTIRHEGAHQLFYDYGIHSRHGVEGEWLIEGLATYCETSPIGGTDPVRAGSLKRAKAEGALIGLEELVGLRSDRGLMGFGAADRIALAYDQSWGLVHFLMQPDTRMAFLSYLRHLRDPAHFHGIRRAGHLATLCRFLECSAEELWRRWMEYLDRLPA